VRINVRDPVSLDRFRRSIGRAATLVADAAFLLEPGVPAIASQDAAAWVAARKREGRTVIALNYHGLLFEDPARGRLALLQASVAAALGNLALRRSACWLLLPHDSRPQADDIGVLSALYDALPAGARASAYLVPAVPPAAEIKGLVAMLDGVVAGRMHLAIAALGTGTPVMAFDYQGKFLGLFRHFRLPEHLLLDPVEATDPAFLTPRLESFLDELSALRGTIAAELPSVRGAAALNFAALHPPGTR
jgi:polysaccharide pyruvyl transferase WcaK-like protein